MIEDIEKISGYESMTPQQIADQLNASHLHLRNAYITGGNNQTDSVNFLHLLTVTFRVMNQDKSQSWAGPLVDAADSNASIDNIMRLLYPHLQVKDSVVYCGTSEASGQMVNGLMAAVTSIVTAAGTHTAQQVVEAVAKLTGGRKYGSVTAQQVSAALAEKASDEQDGILTNAKAFFSDRMTIGGDANAVWAQAWTDAGGT